MPAHHHQKDERHRPDIAQRSPSLGRGHPAAGGPGRRVDPDHDGNDDHVADGGKDAR
jgi:hypothetical protein